MSQYRHCSQVPTGLRATGGEQIARLEQIQALIALGWDYESVKRRLEACDQLHKQTKTVLAGIERRNPDKSLQSIESIRIKLELL